MSGTVNLILEQYHRALDAVVSGNSAPMKELISRREDVTLANPLGPPVRGWENVEKTMDHAISHFREGEPTRFERISEFVGTELAYIVELERTAGKDCGIGRAGIDSPQGDNDLPPGRRGLESSPPPCRSHNCS